MDLKAFDAISAYGKSAALKSVDGGASEAVSQATKSTFASMVETGAVGGVEATANMEATVAANLNGRAELLDVVTAVTSAEMAVETVVAVRDKVLSAYNDIIKMPI